MTIENPISALMFSLGFIWLIGALISIFLGPFVGYDRKRIKVEAMEFYRKLPSNIFKRTLLHILLSIAAVGFFIPTVYPIIGIVGSLFFFALM